MGKKRTANPIEPSSTKKTGRKTRRRAAEDAPAAEDVPAVEDAPAAENATGAEDVTGAEFNTGAKDTGGAKKTARGKKTAGAKKTARGKKTAGDKKTARGKKTAGDEKTAGDKKKAETTGVKTRGKLEEERLALRRPKPKEKDPKKFEFDDPEKKMRQNRAAVRKAAAAAAAAEAEDVEDEEANPDGDGEDGVAKEASFDGVESGDELAEVESGDEVEEDKSEDDQAAAASSKGKRVKKEGKANKNRMEVVIKYCKHSGPLFKARAEELKAALESGPGFNVRISNKVNTMKENNAGKRKDSLRHSTMAALLLTILLLPIVAADTAPTQISSHHVNHVNVTEDESLKRDTADKLKAEAGRIRAETGKLEAETESIKDMRPWLTPENFLSGLMMCGFVAIAAACIWLVVWFGLIGDYCCSKFKFGNLKRARELEKAQLIRLIDIDICMREFEGCRVDIERIANNWRDSKKK